MAQLSDDQAAFLRDNPYYAVLTTLRPDGSPHSTVVWIDVDESGRPAFNTARGRAKPRHIENDPRIGSRLAMWGRRLVGDTLLVARSALASHAREDQERLEPVWTELIAAHTRRMDALGLTA